MDTNAVTTTYYSRWVGSDLDRLPAGSVQFVYNPARNLLPAGYSETIDLYVLVFPDRIAVSYGDRAAAGVQRLRPYLTGPPPVGETAARLERCFDRAPAHSLKFVLRQPRLDAGQARRLTAADYPAYHDFFCACHPGCADVGWLRDYFDAIVADDLCFGVFQDGRLLSATDAPPVPFLSDQVREIGINTRPDARQKGYARAVCSACMQSMLSRGVCPLWSTTRDNIASVRLAQSLGFGPYAALFSMTL